MSLDRIKNSAQNYKQGNPAESVLRNKHMNKLSAKIIATREAIDEVIDLFVKEAEISGKFNDMMNMPAFMDALVEVAKAISSKALSLLSRNELTQDEADALIVDLANYTAAPIDMALNTNDIQ